MKSIVSLFIGVCLVLISSAQTGTEKLPVYSRFPTIPQFTIYKAPDSSAFTRDNLKKKPTVFMVFDPGCDHCQHATDSIIAHISRFKNAQIIMITYLPHEDMLKFYKEYKIAKYSVITMGSDPKYFFTTFFQVRSLPAIFVYDKSRKLKDHFEGTIQLNKITAAL